MDVIGRVRAFAFARPHVLVLEAANGTASRLEVERWLRTRSWPASEQPADTDVLMVCGNVTAELAPIITRIQRSVP